MQVVKTLCTMTCRLCSNRISFENSILRISFENSIFIAHLNSMDRLRARGPGLMGLRSATAPSPTGCRESPTMPVQVRTVGGYGRIKVSNGTTTSADIRSTSFVKKVILPRLALPCTKVLFLVRQNVCVSIYYVYYV